MPTEVIFPLAGKRVWVAGHTPRLSLRDAMEAAYEWSLVRELVEE